MSVDFSSDGRLLLGGNQSGRIVLWDLSKGHVLREWPAHAKSLTCAIFSPNGKYIASAGADSAGGEGSDDEVRLWDVASGREIRRLFGHHGVICTLAFSPDDRELFTGGRDQTIGVWEVESGTLRHMQRSHAGDVQSLSLNFDGTRLASCSDDHTMTIWNVATSQELQTLNPQAGAILSVAFAPDGTRVAAACPDDALVSVWDARPLTAELRNEIDATNLLATLLPVATSPEDLCRRIRETPLIEESVRKLALERAEADWRSRNGDSAATPLRNWLRRWIPLPTK
jgi:WD40 repeat protein